MTVLDLGGDIDVTPENEDWLHLLRGGAEVGEDFDDGAKAYNPNQPRGAGGRWSGGGSSGGSAATGGTHGGAIGGAHESGWKPTMTAKEAEAWAKDSVLKEPHYTGKSKPDKVVQMGFIVPAKTNNMSMMGRGVYLMTNPAYTSKYGYNLETRLNVKKPLDMYSPEAKALLHRGHSPERDTPSQYDRHLAGYTDEAAAALKRWRDETGQGGSAYHMEGRALAHVAQAHGYDALYYTSDDGTRVINVFNPKAVTVVSDSEHTQKALADHAAGRKPVETPRERDPFD